MPKLKIEHIQQPKESHLCGQACVAMVARVSLEEAIQVMGTRGRTRPKQLAVALRHYGFRAKGKLVRVHKGTTIEQLQASVYTRTSIVRFYYPWGGDLDDWRSHWTLLYSGQIYDPVMKEPGKICGHAYPYKKITSYLPFSRWVEFS